MGIRWYRAVVTVMMCAAVVSGCGWRGVNSLPLPGTEGNGPGSFEIRAQLPDVTNIQQNSRVRVGDVTVGHVTRLERQGWHALVTMRLDGNVDLPANATAKVGQTSLLGSLHIELAPPVDTVPEGKLRDGSLIPLSSGSAYPTTEQTLAALSALLNGGGLGQVQEITKAFSTAFAGREDDLRSLISQLDQFIARLNDQKDDIIKATDSLNRLVGQFAAQKPVMDKALRAIPDALNVLKDERNNLAEAVDRLGEFSAVAADSANQTKDCTRARTAGYRSGTGVIGQRGPGADPLAELLRHIPVAERNSGQMVARGLRQHHRRRRPHPQPFGLRPFHRHALGR